MLMRTGRIFPYTYEIFGKSVNDVSLVIYENTRCIKHYYNLTLKQANHTLTSLFPEPLQEDYSEDME